MEKWRLKGSGHIAGFLSFLRDVQTGYNIAAEAEDEAGRKTQDILHRLELWDDGHQDMEQMAELLRGVRRERRDAKDARMEAEPVISWISQNQKTISGLEALLGDVRQIEKSNAQRPYIFKTDVLKSIVADGMQAETGEKDGVNNGQRNLQIRNPNEAAVPVSVCLRGNV